MKVIVDNSNLSRWIFNDDVILESSESGIVVGDPPKFIIQYLNSINCNIYDDVTDTPSDWVGCKYFYDGTDWTFNAKWFEVED